MTKTFPLLPDYTCPELAGYKLPELPRSREDDVEKQYSEELDKRWEIAKNYKGQVAGRHPDAFNREEMKGMIRGYMEAREKFEFSRQDLIDLVQSLKDYTAESNNILGHDEREPSEFVDIFLNGRTPRTPIGIEVEMVVNCTGNNDNGCFLDSCGHDCGCIKPATNPDGTVKVVKWIFNE